MKIKKVLNNNFVVCGDNNEKIIMGIGLGYRKRKGDIVEDVEIDKIFQLTDSRLNEMFVKLISSVSVEIVEVVNEVVSLAEENLHHKISIGIFMALLDHIQSTINLHIKGKYVSNPLIWDIKYFYKKEFEIGEYALKLINKNFNLNLPQDEAGFIALHIVNASLNQSGDTYKLTRLIKDILEVIKNYFEIVLDTNSMCYQRLIAHLRFFGQRVIQKDKVLVIDSLKLFELTRNEFPEAYNCSLKIKDLLLTKYKFLVSEEELLYLMVHIQRILHQQSEDLNKC